MSSADNGARPVVQPSRPRKTSIQGTTGTWNLGKTIGAGSMGKVKLARKSDGTEQVAVKIVPRQHTTERDVAAGHSQQPRHDDSKEIRTAREAAIMTLLDHPYVCGMRDVIKTSNHWYMLCEYVNGGQMLDYIISHGRLKEKQARKFARQIASALDYCHRNSIVHRDLKIENILISKTGDIKIIDFGLSNLFSPRSRLKTFCGSLYFAAPELLQAKQYVGPEVDVWSFGIVLYVLVCGKVPFDDQSMPALHAKIKRGVVDYPQWLSNDCRHLLSRMLVTDPRSRATLSEILHHPWLIKGHNGPPDNFLPPRDPILMPLDQKVIQGMTGFEFGNAEVITSKLTGIIESEEYQAAVQHASREPPLSSPNPEKKKGFGFDFYKRRSSTSSKETLVNPSSELLVPSGPPDPINAYHPLISIYYLVREKLVRDRQKQINGTQVPLPTVDIDKMARISVPKQPEPAHTSETSYEVKGEPHTIGRIRPRARTHGDEEVSEALKNADLGAPALSPSNTSVLPAPNKEEVPSKKESGVGGMLRRLSTRRHHPNKGDLIKSEAGKVPSPPTLSLQPPGQAPVNIGTPKKSLSIRRPKGNSSNLMNSTSAGLQVDLLTPPASSDGKRGTKLGRSTSVTETDWRRRHGYHRHSEDSSALSAADRSSIGRNEGLQEDSIINQAKNLTARAKSVGHAQRGSFSRRRARQEANSHNVLEEEDIADAGTSAGSGDGDMSGTPSVDYVKPVFLKGLFSVSTTSTKPPLEIRKDIIRVLEQLGVSFREIKSGFSCVHRPSIDLKSVVENAPHTPEAGAMVTPSSSHRRKASQGGGGGTGASSNPVASKAKRNRADTSYTNSDVSNESVHDGVLGGSLILQFEIYIVKVPLLSLHGIQFKSVNKTNTWQYKSLASRILSELRL